MRVILKILLSVALLGVVVGVSYLKTAPTVDSDSGMDTVGVAELDAGASPGYGSGGTEENDETKSSAEEAKKSVAVEPETNDSASGAFGTPRIMALGSQSGASAPDGAEDTAMTVAVSAGDSLDSKNAADSDEVDSDKENREGQIILYFQRKLSALPNDLSSYEKKVAIKEVRDETCDLFHISRVKLNQLARRHKVVYP